MAGCSRAHAKIRAFHCSEAVIGERRFRVATGSWGMRTAAFGIVQA